MEHVEPSVNKWKKVKKSDYTYKGFGQVYGFFYGFALGVVIGIIMDKLFLYATIGAVAGIVVGGLIGGRYKNHKKIQRSINAGTYYEGQEIADEDEEKKIQV